MHDNGAVPVAEDVAPYDALIVVSFGGPEGPADVLPFLANVTRGRGIPPDRLAEVGAHYNHFGGVSPINAQNRRLVAGVRAELAARGADLPVYWGNRNWHPFLVDELARMADDGVRRALAFVTSAYGSYSACRQYQDDVAAARAQVGERAPVVDKIRHFFDHPGFLGPQVDGVRAVLATVGEVRRASTRLVFTAHSIPCSMADSAGPDGGLYVAQLRAAARLVAQSAAPDLAYDLVWQSRSGPPQVPWLEPDVNDHLRTLAGQGVTDVVVVPVGFVSDHVEVLWDLDVEAAATAREVGIALRRTATAGTDPRFVAMVADLVAERTTPGAPRPAGSPLGPGWDRCQIGCCPAPARAGRPAT